MASGSGVEKNALNSSAAAQGTAANALGTVNPIYSELATGDVGLTPEQKNNLRTASMQSTGGSVAAATGLGQLEAARTGNAGAYQGAIDDAARQGMQQESQNSLDIENKDAEVARQNQKLGLAGLSGIYDDASKTGVDYLNTAQSASANKRNSTFGLLNPVASILGANKSFQNLGQ